MKDASPVKTSVYISLFTAMTVVGGYIAIPVGPVPIVLSNFFILLSGILLGSRKGTAVTVTYLILGFLGLPVFAGGTSGLARLAGPTGGYLLGYLPAVFTAGLIAERGKNSFLRNLAAMISGVILIYAVGVPWLRMSLGLDWKGSFISGMLPFLPGDGLKAAAGAFIGLWLHESTYSSIRDNTADRNEPS